MRFENIIGNKKVKEYLLEQVKKDDILHSYLFMGTESIGKFLIAKEFAKKILCNNTGEDLCTCNSCVCFENNNHPDYMIINNEESESIKIEQIRNLCNKIIEKPIKSNKKVYIINDCEKMTRDAQNCLLKTLEEPPEFAVIILITSNENLLLNTIKSRCMKVNFNSLSDNELKKYCIETLNYQNISEKRLKTFNGSIGKALKFKENEVEFEKIESLINDLKSKDVTQILKDGKIIYNKEKIYELLDYIINYLFISSNQNKKFLNCIGDVNDTINKLNANGNFDMNLDMMLIKMWEEVNEKSNRS